LEKENSKLVTSSNPNPNIFETDTKVEASYRGRVVDVNDFRCCNDFTMVDFPHNGCNDVDATWSG
jgi:hypothetical protein